MLLLPTILSDLPFGKRQGEYLADLLPLLAGLPGRPTHRHLARFGDRCPHTHSRQAARPCDFAALNLAGLCAVVPYEHELAWAGDSTFIPKSGRKLPGVGWRWHGGEGRVAWGQQFELLSVLDLDEHCSYPVHGCLQPASAPRSRRRARRSRPPRAEVAAMLALLDEALAVEHRPDIDVFVGDGHYACEPMVAGLADRGLDLVGKLRRDAALWVPWTEPPTGRPRRPPAQVRGPLRPQGGQHRRSCPQGRAAGRGPAAVPCAAALQALQRTAAGWSSSWTPDADPAEVSKPTTLFATDPEMAPERIHRIHRDRFQIEFNFRDRPAAPGAGRLPGPHRRPPPLPRQRRARGPGLDPARSCAIAAQRALDRFSMANVKLGNFLEMVLARLLAAVGPDRTLRKCPEALRTLLELGQIEPKPT